MSNDTTTTSPVLSAQETSDSLGVEIAVVHEKDAVVLIQTLRIPRGDALRTLIDAMQANDAGYHRVGGPGER